MQDYISFYFNHKQRGEKRSVWFSNLIVTIDDHLSEWVCGVTCRFRALLKHKDDGQIKFIKPNAQRQDIIIKYWVSIGSIHRE